MKRLLIASGFALVAAGSLFHPASAQTASVAATCSAQSLPTGYLNGTLIQLQNGDLCTTPGTGPVPVFQDPLVAVAGTQRAVAIATATSPTVPATATVILIQAQGSNNSSNVCLYWQDDGTAPTASAGQQMPAGGGMFYRVSTLPIQFIAATGATCTVTLSYYKDK